MARRYAVLVVLVRSGVDAGKNRDYSTSVYAAEDAVTVDGV